MILPVEYGFLFSRVDADGSVGSQLRKHWNSTWRLFVGINIQWINKSWLTLTSITMLTYTNDARGWRYCLTCHSCSWSLFPRGVKKAIKADSGVELQCACGGNAQETSEMELRAAHDSTTATSVGKLRFCTIFRAIMEFIPKVQQEREKQGKVKLQHKQPGKRQRVMLEQQMCTGMPCLGSVARMSIWDWGA